MMMMMEWEIQKLVKNIFVGGKQIVNQCNHQKILTFLKAAIRKDGIKSIFHFFSIHEVFSGKKHKTLSFYIGGHLTISGVVLNKTLREYFKIC